MRKYNYQQAQFFDTVNDLEKLPQSSSMEVAIVGRSNVGKSSLINTLTQQRRLAYTSKTPGCTQHINYFSLPQDGLFLVDLPGYGYAKVPQKIRIYWIDLLEKYLATRKQLIGLILITDIRHPLKPLDYQMIEFFSIRNKPIHIVLSKADKLSTQEQNKVLISVKQQLNQKSFNNLSIQLFSSLKPKGCPELEETLNKWFDS